MSQSTAVDDYEGIKQKPVSPPPSSVESPEIGFAVESGAALSELQLESTPVKVVDGSEVVSNVVYQLSDIAFIYPVLSQEYPGHQMQQWTLEEKKNAKNIVPKVINMTTQSGSGNSVLGALLAGSSANVILSSAAIGHLLPSMFGFQRNKVFPVFHVAAHSIGDDLTIQFDHSDVYDAAYTGFTIIASSDISESQDLAIISHLVSRASKTPTLHFFDGSILTSQKTPVKELTTDQILKSLHLTKDIYGNVHDSFLAVSKKLEHLFGRRYSLIDYMGSSNPSIVFVSLGLASSFLSKAINKLASEGHRVGFVNVRVLKPWSAEDFVSLIPGSTSKIVVVDQFSRKGHSSPLTREVEASFYGSRRAVDVFHAQFDKGLHHIHPQAVLDFVFSWAHGGHSEVISLSDKYEPKGAFKSGVEAIFWDKNEDETSEAVNHLINDQQSLKGHHYQSYKQWLSTSYEPSSVSHIRFSTAAIKATHLISDADLVFLNSFSIAQLYNYAKALKFGGKLFVNTSHTDEELNEKLAGEVRQILMDRNVTLYALDVDLVARNYTLFYGDFKNYRSEILAGIFYSRAYQGSQAARLREVQLARLAKINEDSSIRYTLKESINHAINHVRKVKIDYVSNASIERLPLPNGTVPSKSTFTISEPTSEVSITAVPRYQALLPIVFPSAFNVSKKYRPDLEQTYSVKITESIRLTPESYERNVFHMELDITGTDLKYDIGNALAIYPKNGHNEVAAFLKYHGYDGNQVVFIERTDEDGKSFTEVRSLEQILLASLDLFGKPGKKFFQTLASFATDDAEKEDIAKLLESNENLDKYMEDLTPTYADLLKKYESVKFTAQELVSLIPNIKPRLYSISSSQRAHPNSIHLLIVLVDWETKDGRKRFGQATRYLIDSKIGDALTVSLKSSVMKLPPSLESPVIMSGLGTGMAPFRAFIEERMYWKKKGKKVGPMALYFGSRNRANEYLYGEELEAYNQEGILTFLRLAFSRDQKEKIYIQHKIQEDASILHKLIVEQGGSFYLCGPTWPVPDVTNALLKAFSGSMDQKQALEYIEQLKEHERFVLEVY